MGRGCWLAGQRQGLDFQLGWALLGFDIESEREIEIGIKKKDIGSMYIN